MLGCAYSSNFAGTDTPAQKEGFIVDATDIETIDLIKDIRQETACWVKLTQAEPSIYDDVQLLLGHEMRKRRKQAGLTQIQLSSQIFYSASTISNIEHGYIFPNMLAFNNMCLYFKLMAGSLIYLSELYCLYKHQYQVKNNGEQGDFPGGKAKSPINLN
ncbi:MAG: helix-turn-helix transcriptional regulator [Eubacteriales bacterium]|nr:helix-turn-helix transcriptional regulator [Eubacteriales bacterium]